MRRNPKISGTTHNVFGIQTDVAIGFFVRDKSRSGECNIHYVCREDAEVAKDKLAYVGRATLGEIAFADIAPDAKNNWLNQSNPDFDKLMPLVDKQTKLAKTVGNSQAVFDMFSNGAKTNRDEWVYDFNLANLRDKVLFFTDVYNGLLDRDEKEYDPTIKWSSTLRDRFHRSERIVYNDANRVESLYRPFVLMHHFTDMALNDRLTRNHYEIFGPDLKHPKQGYLFLRSCLFQALSGVGNRQAVWI